MSEQATIAAGGSGTVDFEAKVRFRKGMSAPVLTDVLVQEGFAREVAGPAAERVYARRVTDVHANGVKMLLGGAVVTPLSIGLLVVTLMSGWFIKILAIGPLAGIMLIVGGLQQISEARAAGPKK